MSDVVIYGVGDLARLAHLCLEDDSPHRVVGFTVDQAYRNAETYQGLPLVSSDDLAAEFPPRSVSLFVAIGYRRVNAARAEVYRRVKDQGYRLVTYVSSRALVASSATIGDNCFVFEGVIIQPFVTVGDDTIIWSGAVVAHDTTIGDHCFLAPRASISGRTSVGDYVFVGNNATVRDGVTVASRTVIGAGALIKHDTQPGQIYPGPRTPARPDSDSSQLDDL